MTDIAELGLSVDSRPLQKSRDELGRFLKKSQETERGTTRAMNAIGGSFRRVGGFIASFAAGLSAAALFRTSIANTIEQERVIAQLNATLRSTGNFTPKLSKAMQDYASQLQAVTTFGDEAIIPAQSMLLTFTKIGGETFPRATEAILDVATAMNTDLKSATIQVGKALNDPIQGLTALSRSGIQFSDTQKELIKGFVETGQVVEAQKIILGELETQFGGSARAAKDTLGGAIQSLKNSFGDLLEGDSGGDGVRGTTQSINDLTDVLNSSDVKQGFQVIVTGALSAAGALAKAAAGFANFGRGVGEFFARIVVGEGDTPLARVSNDLEDARAKLKNLQDEIDKPRLLRINPFASTDSLSAEIDRQAAEVRRLVELREHINRTMPDVDAPDTEIPPINFDIKGADAAVDDLGKVDKATQKTRDAIAGVIATLKEEADTFDLSRRQSELLRLERDGATRGEIEQADALLETIEALEKKQKAEQDGLALVRELRTEEEQRTDTMREQLAVLEQMEGLSAAQRKDIEVRIVTEATGIENIEQSLMTEEERLRDSYERRRAMILEFTERTGIEKNDLLRRLDEEFQMQQDELNATFWERWLESADEAFTNMDERVGALLDNMTQGFGNAFESMIFDSDNAGDALRNMLVSIGRQAANTLGQMAAQWLIYQLVQKATGKSTATAAASTIALQAQAMSQMAALNAFSSTAAIPIVGPAAAPAAAAAALAATQPIAATITTLSAGMVGVAHDGIDNVPREGTWLLDRGERVVDRRTNADLKEALASGGFGGGGNQGGMTVKAVFGQDEFAAAASDWLDSSGGEQSLTVAFERAGLSRAG